ncbi:MAG: hypothetical protein A2847_01990 [Candidatus Sungbacteria bacterium RIFCSPHIGHO2_01_FULL_50_25]|uniref:PrgI family protein n=1 Tax=Candidatus Sungbacteria bacterium RIFCSPHIGHO2_01_FULL_50_25 TaxID=1802265 RepID=A0A1G2KBK2_9BACT|nr:MAG: hypothetical protein A2847_01990 [Candidatus Sungbacteria bacterium RIFCSPHIGHO2_01_FULL_50_25]
MTYSLAVQRFQVPQFITVEDKIIGGFLTAKQFAYLASGVILIVVIFFQFTGFLALVLSFFVGASAVALAWGKISEIPVGSIVVHAVKYFIRPRVFVWKRAQTREVQKSAGEHKEEETRIQTSPKLSHSRLSELSWTLDTKTHEERRTPLHT